MLSNFSECVSQGPEKETVLVAKTKEIRLISKQPSKLSQGFVTLIDLA